MEVKLTEDKNGLQMTIKIREQGIVRDKSCFKPKGFCKDCRFVRVKSRFTLSDIELVHCGLLYDLVGECNTYFPRQKYDYCSSFEPGE